MFSEIFTLFSGASDPYVKLYIKGQMSQAYKTRVIKVFHFVGLPLYSFFFKDNFNPVWNEEFTLNPSKSSDIAEIYVYDKDTLTSDFLGKVELSVSQYINKGNCDEWKPLYAKNVHSHMKVVY